MCRPISPRKGKASSPNSGSISKGIWIALPVGVALIAGLSTTMMASSETDASSLTLDSVISENPQLLVAVVSTIICLVGAVLYVIKNSGPKKTLPLDDFVPMPLIRKEVLSHDTRRFTFALPDSTAVLGLPTGQHVSLKFTDPTTQKPVQRSYTPVTDDTTAVGEFSLVIKVYRPMPPKFPEGGKMSQHLDDLPIGDTILVKGPKGHLTYTNETTGSNKASKFTVKPLGKPLEHRAATSFGMMAGGTGITPMLQILNKMYRHADSNDKINVKLIYANQTVDDILVRTELEQLQRDFPNRFSLYYTVDKAPTPAKNGEQEQWKYGTGFITKDMIEKHLLVAGGDDKNQQFFMCGPPPMIKFACLPALTELGFSDKDWVVF